MKLYSPAFEKALRRGVKRAVKSSPELRREYRAASGYRKNFRLGVGFRVVLSLLLGLLVWSVTDATGHTEAGLSAITFWAFVLVFIHAHHLWSHLFGARDLAALSLLPLTEGQIFHWEFQKSLRNFYVSLFDFLAGFGVLALYLGFSAFQWLFVVPVAVLSCALTFALAVLCVTRLPRLYYQFCCSAIFLTLTALFIVGIVRGWDAVSGLVDLCAPTLNLVLPTGWGVSVFQLLVPGRQWMFLVLILPVAAVLWMLPKELARLRQNYVFSEHTEAEAPDLIPDSDPLSPDDSPGRSSPLESPRHLGPSAIEQIVNTRAFFSPPQWARRGWFERMLWKWLTPRERVLTEMVFPQGAAISARWVKIFRNFGIAVVAGLAAGLVSIPLKITAVSVGVFVAFCAAIAAMLESGTAFRSIFCSGVNIPLHAAFPIGMRELSRLLFKVSAVQIPALFAWTTLCSLLILQLSGNRLLDGPLYGFRVSCLILSFRFMLMVFNFSSGTNDTSGFGLRTITLLLFLFGTGGLFLVLAGASLFVPHRPHAVFLTLLAMLNAFVFFRGYSWFYNIGRFDLMSVPRQS